MTMRAAAPAGNRTARFIEVLTSQDEQVRHSPVESLCEDLGAQELWEVCLALDEFRRDCDNLYERVRALFFIYAICRFHLPERIRDTAAGRIPAAAHNHLLERRFSEAVDTLLAEIRNEGMNDALCSALAQACHQLALQFLADQVRRSVRSVKGNQWMFRCGHPAVHPLRIRRELFARRNGGLFPLLHEKTAVRMDLSHSGWSDIFFLGMDYPEGARVLNVSVDLAVEGRDAEPAPPVQAMFRVIEEPVIRLTSIDLGATADITSLDDFFDFAKDYLGLLKAGVIAAGVVPIGMEGSGASLEELLKTIAGEGRGFELASFVNGIPKGSRLAVSTNLLGAMIAVCMRATGQTARLEGPLDEGERRIVAARAILGEWLGGSGGGWQDSGGIWPGIKVICGQTAASGDAEHGVSRGRLLPSHRLLGEADVPDDTRRKLQDSLVLVHGGMAQNVGPILEMVTEKYLLRCAPEWSARNESREITDGILSALREGDIRKLGGLTTRHFRGPLQAIMPWCTNAFTERLIDAAARDFGDDFWGFWMLGGMAGGGMGFIFAPERAVEARGRMLQILRETKCTFERALPFAMDPVVYSFSINNAGTTCRLMSDHEALMPPAYYPLMIPSLLRTDPRALPEARRVEAGIYGSAASRNPDMRATIEPLVTNLLPQSDKDRGIAGESLDDLLARLGFDPVAHERIRADLRAGLTGLAQNRMPPQTSVEDVQPGDVLRYENDITAADRKAGLEALSRGEVAMVTLAAGAGSRWTEGAGVVKALHPFCKFGGRHRSFIEVHLAKCRRTAEETGTAPAYIVTTGYLTDSAIRSALEAAGNFGYQGNVFCSFGRSIGLRLIPMVRDLRFHYEETRQQILDERKQKMRENVQGALISWALAAGEGSDYRDNVPGQCLHPVGHWFEIPNLLLNGTLLAALREHPNLRTLFLHNLDTAGAGLDAGLLGLHRRAGTALTFEVIPRRIDDRGGGLARINGQVRLVEGMALPHEDDEFRLTYYNSQSTWIDIDALLRLFGLDRTTLSDSAKVSAAVRDFAARLPTYITLKDVKKRWGHGQEDIYPVTQFEKLWSDMTALPDVSCGFVVVPRARGQQLKAQAQLDGWLRDGSAAAVDHLCSW